jgi:hypothetical protein
MNDEVRRKLGHLIATYGRDLADDPRRCQALLRDLCPGDRAEVAVLTAAAEEGIPDQLRSSSAPFELTLPRLAAGLAQTRALDAEAARWAVQSWANALGIEASANSAAGHDSAPADDPRKRGAAEIRETLGEVERAAVAEPAPVARSRPAGAGLVRRLEQDRRWLVAAIVAAPVFVLVYGTLVFGEAPSLFVVAIIFGPAVAAGAGLILLDAGKPGVGAVAAGAGGLGALALVGLALWALAEDWEYVWQDLADAIFLLLSIVLYGAAAGSAGVLARVAWRRRS